MRLLRARGRGAIAVAALTGVAIASGSGAALAAHGEKLAPEKLVSPTWVISINHEIKPLPRNDRLTYCTTAVLESITPKFTLTSRSAGYHPYAYHIVNPAGERSTNLYGSFNGTKTVVESAFQPLDWARGEEKETDPQFKAGTYTMQIALNAEIIHGLPTTKMVSVQKLILVPTPPPNC